jgi:hypothetical protein
MFSNRMLGLMAALALSVWLPINAAHACACCAEPGERSVRTEVMDEHALAILGAVRFGGKARLYTTAADWAEQIRGITNRDESDTYDLKISRTARAWTFELSDDKGHKGRLTFRLATSIHKFHADTKPQAKISGRYFPTNLYKEWRLAGGVIGNGMFTFKKSTKSRVELILHGSGNGCTSVDQFNNWTLDVVGRGVHFRFFGALRTVN